MASGVKPSDWYVLEIREWVGRQVYVMFVIQDSQGVYPVTTSQRTEAVIVVLFSYLLAPEIELTS